MKKQEPLPFRLNILAGALAGACELITMYPLDVVKTRAQQIVGGKLSIIQSLSELLKEGGPPRLYRGILLAQNQINFFSQGFFLL